MCPEQCVQEHTHPPTIWHLSVSHPYLLKKNFAASSGQLFSIEMAIFSIAIGKNQKKIPPDPSLSSTDPIREQKDSAVLTRRMGTYKEVALTKVASNHTY